MSDRIAYFRIVKGAALSLLLLFPGQPALAGETEANAAEPQQVEQPQKQIDEPEVNVGKTEPTTSQEMPKKPKAAAEKKKFTVSGYTQLRYESFEHSLDGDISDAGLDVQTAKMKITALLVPRLKAVVQIDVGSSDVQFQDVYAEYSLRRKREFAIGQMKWPFGYEVTNSSSNREAPERARIFKRLFPGQRDRGATLEGRLGKDVDWIIGLFDGTGIQEVNEEITDRYGRVISIVSRSITHDYNNHKDIVGRLTWERGNAEFGLSSYIGEGIWNKRRTLFLDQKKNRYGAEFRYFGDKWTLKNEYVRGKGVDEFDSDFGYSKWISGYYSQLSYNLGSRSMLVARYSTMSQDPNEPQLGRRSAWDLGWLGWLSSRTRVRLFYQINRESESPIDNNGFTAECQVVY